MPPIADPTVSVDELRSAPTTPWGQWVAWSLLIWGAAALYAVSRSYVQGRFAATDRLFTVDLGNELRALLIWAAATPAIVAIARRYPFERRHWGRHLGLHVAVSVVFVYALQVGVNAPFFVRGEWGLATLAVRSGQAFVSYYHLAGLVYGVIVAAVMFVGARKGAPPARVEAGQTPSSPRQPRASSPHSVPDPEAVGTAGNEATAPGRLAVKVDDGIVVIDDAAIAWIDAEGDYVRIHSDGKELLLRDRLKNLETRLDPARFVRIHRSTIVNVDRVQRLHPFFHGDYAVVLDDGTELRLSRTHRDALAARIGHPL